MRAIHVVAALSVVLVLALSAVCAANPAPSLVGPTGLVTVPSTEVVGAQAVDLAAHFFKAEICEWDYDVRIWQVNWGPCDTVEISLAWAVEDDQGDNWDNTTFGIKWAPLQEPDNCMGLAVGVYNVGAENKDEYSSQDGAIWYIVGSKSLTDVAAGERPVRVDFGLEVSDDAYGPGGIKAHTSGLARNWGAGDLGDSPNFFLGLDAEVADWLTVVCDTNEFDDFNFGARLNITDDLYVDAQSLDYWGLGHRFVGGVGYHVTWD